MTIFSLAENSLCTFQFVYEEIIDWDAHNNHINICMHTSHDIPNWLPLKSKWYCYWWLVRIINQNIIFYKNGSNISNAKYKELIIAKKHWTIMPFTAIDVISKLIV